MVTRGGGAMSAGLLVPILPSPEPLGPVADGPTPPPAPGPRAEPGWVDAAAALLSEVDALPVVFFVPRVEVARGRHPTAEPVVVADLALAHRHPFVQEVVVIDRPNGAALRGAAGATPIFAISPRELIFHPRARRVTIAEDRRTNEYVLPAD